MREHLTHQLRELLDRARESWPLPGISLCLVERETELFTIDAGWADAERRTPVSATTRFQIGSISKSFTGMVVAMLAEEGQVDLTAPVTRYLPWFSVRSTFAMPTVRDLLHHSAGIIAGGDAFPDALAQACSLRDTTAGTAPGTTFHYSNAGYQLLGLIIEAVTGHPLADVVSERLLVPLGMAQSRAEITHQDHHLLATGYRPLHDDRPTLPRDPLIPAAWFEFAGGDGNVMATASDLGRYARMLLGAGIFDGRQVVSRAAFERATADFGPSDMTRAHGQDYAYGLGTDRVAGHRWLTHAGGMVGYGSYLAADVDAGLGIVVLTNAPGESAIPELLARRGLAIALGMDDAEPDPTDRTVIAATDDLVGTYRDGDHEIVVRRGGDGSLLLESEGRSGVLYETGQGRLVCDHPDWRIFPHAMTGTGGARRWTWGPLSLAPEESVARPVPVTGSHPLEGLYRTYSPWYPTFRIVRRAGRLHLIAAVGVEAPWDEPELAPIGESEYRIGDEGMPERLVTGPIVDGVAAWIDRDGCRYSRSLT